MKKRYAKLIIAFASLVGSGLLLAVAAFWIWPPGLLLGMYKIEDSVSAISPDGRYVATGYHIIGSAVVHNQTIIQIQPNQFFGGGTSILIADNLKPFHISWDGNTGLVVTYSPDGIYSQESKWRDVTIRYIQE